MNTPMKDTDEKIHCNSFFDDVYEFRKKFNLDDAIVDELTMWDEVRKKIHHIDEERTELLEALYSNPNGFHDAADAIVDLIYVLCGLAHILGVPLNECWKRVHEANMKKQRVNSKEESKRHDPFDLKKPIGWIAPSFHDIMNKQFPFSQD